MEIISTNDNLHSISEIKINKMWVISNKSRKYKNTV
jgi:hypothetical protein